MAILLKKVINQSEGLIGLTAQGEMVSLSLPNPRAFIITGSERMDETYHRKLQEEIKNEHADFVQINFHDVLANGPFELTGQFKNLGNLQPYLYVVPYNAFSRRR